MRMWESGRHQDRSPASCKEPNIFTRILLALRRVFRRSPLAGLLRATGLARAARQVHEQHFAAGRTHEADIAGHRLKFNVSSYRELVRIDTVGSDEPILGQLLKAVRPTDICFDVGANIGIMTVLLATRLDATTGCVHAFEPEPRNAEHLGSNVRLNKLEKVAIHECALANETGRATFHVEPELGAGAHSLVEGHGRATQKITIETVRGDEFIAQHGVTPDLMKIDVEGAEMDVLRGFSETLAAKRIRDVFVEVHTQTLERLGSSAEELRAWMEARGYRRVWTHGRSDEYHDHYRREE